MARPSTRYTDLWPTNYKLGMWVWLLHRVSGVILILYGMAHVIVISTAAIGDATFDRLMEAFSRPWVLALELLIIAAVLYHTLNGLRIILFNLGIGIRVQKQLFWALMVVAAALLGVITYYLYPYIAGEPLT